VASAFDHKDLESLDTLARLGFTFALDDVDHVEMDFESLLSRGLAFVKVSADVFRHGLIAGEAVIPTDEVRTLFEDAGLQLIVHHISDEAGLDAALAHHVTFGQGNLFAQPKPVKADLLGEANRAA
jgi:cyclic-di-GMP phosphodiesterase, flagellum assembly factor TipF